MVTLSSQKSKVKSRKTGNVLCDMPLGSSISHLRVGCLSFRSKSQKCLKGLFMLSLVLLFGLQVQAQEDIVKQKHGMLKFTGGIEPGYMFSPRLLNLYLSGHLEYYLQERVSVRGDIYYFVDTQGGDAQLLANHGLFFGAAYHFLDKPVVDPYLGFQPGVQLTRVQYWDDNSLALYKSPYKLVPVASVIGGANFFVSRFFNFYVATRGVFGSHRGGGAPTSLNLGEWRISFGLGFNVGLLK